MVITKVLVHLCPPPPINFCPPSYYLSLSLPARFSFYLFLSHLVSGNRIEAQQWIVARHLLYYNPLSCFTPFCGVKYDKIKFHEFFCVCNFFSFSHLSLSLSLSLSLPPLSLYLSLSLPPCLSFSVVLSLSHSLSYPRLSLSPVPIFLSLSNPGLSSYLHLSPFFSPCSYLSFSLSPIPVSLSLPRKKENTKFYCNIEKENL